MLLIVDLEFASASFQVVGVLNHPNAELFASLEVEEFKVLIVDILNSFFFLLAVKASEAFFRTALRVFNFRIVFRAEAVRIILFVVVFIT